jgi:hypothetical protein
VVCADYSNLDWCFGLVLRLFADARVMAFAAPSP